MKNAFQEQHLILDFRVLETEEEISKSFPLMRQLREHLDEETFLALVEEARKESGYSLIGVFADSTCLGLMGFRFLTDLVHGRHLYIDDLVTSEAHRSKGVGAQLLDHSKKIAKENGCAKLRLCTGIQNERGKNFYEQNGWVHKAEVFKYQI